MNKKDSIDLEPLAVQLTEAARLLNMCPQTLHTYTMKGEVPHKRVGPRLILYPVEQLRVWLREPSSNTTESPLHDAA
ncbi:MAG: helix-turn-helix domain-containing protein [Blastocatellia bacterium]